MAVSARLHELARAAPGRPALDSTDGRLCYRDLDAAANRVAAFLLERLGRGRHRIGVCTVADHAALVTACGINRAGKICVPLDPFHPISLLQQICADASASLTLTDLAGVLGPDALGVAMIPVSECFAGQIPMPDPAGTRSDATTGIHYLGAAHEPLAGIVVTESSVIRWAEALVRDGVVSAGGRCAMAWSGSAPDAVERLVAMTLTGACAVTGQTDHDLGAALMSGAADSAWLASGTLRRLTSGPGVSGPADRVGAVALWDGPVTGADVVRAQAWFGSATRVVSYFAPPETGVLGALVVDDDEETPPGVLPAGWCAPDVEVETVDPTGCRTSRDEIGHVVAWGESLPSAYWANPAATQRRWLAGPGGRRWCRTGEQGHWDDRGRLVLERARSGDDVVVTLPARLAAAV